jgi:hypothetical protein
VQRLTRLVVAGPSCRVPWSAGPSKHNVELVKSLTVFAQIRMHAGTELRQALADVQEALAIFGPLGPGQVSGYYIVAFTTLADILEKLGATGQARQPREMLEKKRGSGLADHRRCFVHATGFGL